MTFNGIVAILLIYKYDFNYIYAHTHNPSHRLNLYQESKSGSFLETSQ